MVLNGIFVPAICLCAGSTKVPDVPLIAPISRACHKRTNPGRFRTNIITLFPGGFINGKITINFKKRFIIRNDKDHFYTRAQFALFHEQRRQKLRPKTRNANIRCGYFSCCDSSVVGSKGRLEYRLRQTSLASETQPLPHIFFQEYLI